QGPEGRDAAPQDRLGDRGQGEGAPAPPPGRARPYVPRQGPGGERSAPAAARAGRDGARSRRPEGRVAPFCRSIRSLASRGADEISRRGRASCPERRDETMTTNGTRRDKVVSASLIVGAVLAGLAAVAAQRRGEAVASTPPAPAPVV